MSAPGWYHDPASPGGQYRFWDGSAWTNQTMPATGPGGAGAAGGGKPWLWLGIALLAVAALVLFLVLRPGAGLGTTPEDTNSARPTGSQWNELEPTESPSDPEETGAGETIECPRNSTDDRSEIGPDGRMRGGGLSFEAAEGWRESPVYLPWLYDHNSQTRTITLGWQSNLSVGEARESEGFTSPRQTAESIMDCMASSSLFLGFDGREDLFNGEFALDGAPGWRVTANVLVDNQGDIRGDVVDIIVLDTGREGAFSVFISCATIDHEENLAEVARATESLRVE